MTVLVIRPMSPSTSGSGIVSVQYPINIGYLASSLKKNGIDCAVLDFEVERFSEKEFVEVLRKHRPSVVGFSCMTPHIVNGAKIAKIIKKELPEILTVVGGVHATAIPEETLIEFPYFDVVVCGEGEHTLSELYHVWTNSGRLDEVPGIAFKQNDISNIKINPRRKEIVNLNQIPFPDRELVDIKKYSKSHVSRGFSRKTMNIAEVMSSRGCPYNCIFCASKVVHSRRVRFRSSENIVAELEELINRYCIDHFSFLDDTFTLRKGLLEKVCEFMGSRGVSFDCFTRVNDVNKEKLDIMMRGGCKKISFGIESGSPKILKLLKKGITVEEAKKAVAWARTAGLETIETTFMIGNHPDETIEDIELTKKLIYELKPDIMGIFITIPYPGTELNRILKERGSLLQENWDEFKLFFGKPSWELGSIPMVDLERICKKMFYGYHLQPKYLLSQIRKRLNVSDLRYWTELGLSFLKTKYNVYLEK